MNDNKQDNKSLATIQQSGLIRQVDNSLRITNKLLIIRQYDDIVDLFVKNPNFFNRLISKYYPLSDKLIGGYKDVWEFGGCLSQNRSIKWTEDCSTCKALATKHRCNKKLPHRNFRTLHRQLQCLRQELLVFRFYQRQVEQSF